MGRNGDVEASADQRMTESAEAIALELTLDERATKLGLQFGRGTPPP